MFMYPSKISSFVYFEAIMLIFLISSAFLIDFKSAKDTIDAALAVAKEAVAADFERGTLSISTLVYF